VENEHDEAQQAAQAAPQETPAPDTARAGSSRGRLLVGLVIVAAVIAAVVIAVLRTSATDAGAKTTPADITLVTSDRTDVDCVSLKGVRGYYCGYSNEIATWQGDEQNKLKPYYTTDRHLYLVPGLFLEPAIRVRYQSELPNKPREQLKRFTAHCQIKVIDKLPGVRVHWIANSAWSDPQEVEVGLVSNCKIEG
jgi:hypothetical protein